MKIQVVFYSMYGHIHLMAEAVAAGASTVDGAEVSLWRVPELVPEDKLKASGAFAEWGDSHSTERLVRELLASGRRVFVIENNFGEELLQRVTSGWATSRLEMPSEPPSQLRLRELCDPGEGH